MGVSMAENYIKASSAGHGAELPRGALVRAEGTGRRTETCKQSVQITDHASPIKHHYEVISGS